MDSRAAWRTFQPKLQKLKKEISKKFTLKKILIFLPKKVFLIFLQMELSSPKIKKFLSSRNRKNLLRKNFLYFRKWNFLPPSLKTLKFFLNFRRELAEPKKSALKKFLIFLQKIYPTFQDDW